MGNSQILPSATVKKDGGNNVVNDKLHHKDIYVNKGYKGYRLTEIYNKNYTQ